MANLSGTPQAFVGDTSAVDTSAMERVGKRAWDEDGNEYIYLKGVGSTSAGSWVVFDEDYATTLLTAGEVGPVAIAMAAVDATTKYGWYQIFGVNTIAKTDTVAADSSLYIDGTAGRADDLGVSGDLILNAYSMTADTSNVATVWIGYPSVSNDVGGGVSGPGSSTDEAIARFDGVGGSTLQNSGVTIDDSDNVRGVTSLNIDGTGTTLVVSGTATVTGNVGIGTTTPGTRLSVGTGTIDTSSITPLGLVSALTSGRSGTYDASTLGSISTRGDSTSIELMAGTSAGYFSGITATTDGAALFRGTVRLLTAGSERLRIDRTGNVGIGTTAPSSKLHVSGSTIVDGNALPLSNDGGQLGVSGTAWSDLFLASGGVINFGNGNVTLTHSTGLLTSNSPFSLGISNALTTGSIELGHATDTTIARSGAGDITIEGNAVYRAGGTDVSLADGGTGQSLVDPNEDVILFWDDSDTKVTWLGSGTALAISATTLAVQTTNAAQVSGGTTLVNVITPDSFAGSDYGKRVIGVLVTEPGTDMTTGSTKALLRIPSVMNGWNLVGVAATVATAGTTGTCLVQIRNVTDSTLMLSTGITIDSAEVDSSTAAIPAAIDGAADDVATADRIAIDVEKLHTTAAKGLYVEMQFQLP